MHHSLLIDGYRLGELICIINPMVILILRQRNFTFLKNRKIDYIGDSTITEILKAPKITEIDLTFDQNMRPCVAFVSDSIPKLYWYDTKIGDFNIMTFSGILSPRVSLDDKRDFNISNSDIIFAYIKNNGLYYRQQRERFTVEHLLKSYQNNHSKLLWRIGMGINNRFLFYVR